MHLHDVGGGGVGGYGDDLHDVGGGRVGGYGEVRMLEGVLRVIVKSEERKEG